MGSDERAIREVHTTWIDAVNAGDLVRLLTLMTDDVVFLNPGQAPFCWVAARLKRSLRSAKDPDGHEWHFGTYRPTARTPV